MHRSAGIRGIGLQTRKCLAILQKPKTAFDPSVSGNTVSDTKWYLVPVFVTAGTSYSFSDYYQLFHPWGEYTCTTARPNSWAQSERETNTALFKYLPTGHTGNHSIKITVSGYSSATANWVNTLQAVAPNTRYIRLTPGRGSGRNLRYLLVSYRPALII